MVQGCQPFTGERKRLVRFFPVLGSAWRELTASSGLLDAKNCRKMATPSGLGGNVILAGPVLDENRDSRAAKELLNNEAGTICRSFSHGKAKCRLAGTGVGEPILMKSLSPRSRWACQPNTRIEVYCPVVPGSRVLPQCGALC